MRSVNLVPVSCLDTHRRRRRARSWLGAGFVVFVLAVSGAVRYAVTCGAVDSIQARLNEVQAEQADLALQLTAIESQRDALLARAQSLAHMRKTHPLPRQLLQIAANAPDGVVLTELSASPRHEARRPAEDAADEDTGADEPPPLTVGGYAASHADLNALIAVFETIAPWQRVNLVRAVREPFESGTAIAFEIQCGPREGTP